MKQFAVAVAVTLTCMFSTGCASETEYGECVGVLEDQDPELTYKWSTRNIVLAVVFSEMVIVPVYIVLEELQCPVARKPKAVTARRPHVEVDEAGVAIAQVLP